MFIDKQAEFSNSQAVTATAISTNTYDTGGGLNTLKDLGGINTGSFLVIQVDATATAAGAATVTFSVESDSTADLATSPTVHYTSPAIAKTALVPGYELRIPLPSGSYERHIGVRYTVGTGPLTAGAFSAFITNDPQTWRPYANGLA